MSSVLSLSFLHLGFVVTALGLPIAAVSWDVDPVAFSIGPVTVRWYGILFATGFIIGYHMMRSVFRREHKPEEDLETLLFYLIAGTIIGARLGHCFFYHPEYFLNHPLEIPQFWKGGLASHGGVVGVCTTIAIYSRRHKDQPYVWLLDRLCVPAALTSSFIRLGNLFNSEIVGRRTDVPWAFEFKRYYNELLPEMELALPRHPTPLYESGSYFLIFLLLWLLYRVKGPRLRPGLSVGIFLALVFTARFIIEFFKERQATHTADSVLSMGQWLSLPIVLLGLGLAIGSFFRNSPAPEGASEKPEPTVS